MRRLRIGITLVFLIPIFLSLWPMKVGAANRGIGCMAEGEGIPPQSEVLSSSKTYESMYNNKVPVYKSDAGTYPAYAWQPSDQVNVLNHQGGIANQSSWDGLESWDVSQDDHTNSYIHYGDDPSSPNLSLRKYLSETDTEHEFTVKVNVRGNTTYRPGLDILFLLDNSDSMDPNNENPETTRKRNAERALDKLIAELKKVHVPSAENIRIGGHIFSDYTNNAWGSAHLGGKNTFELSNDPRQWDALVKEYKTATAMGATFTQRGLQEAKDMFDAAGGSGRKKMLFILTDGSPNLSWKPTSYQEDENIYYDNWRLIKNDSGSKGNYKKGEFLGGKTYVTKIVPAYAGRINSHITPANSTAMDLKDSGIEIHTISLNITRHLSEVHPNSELIRGLYKLSTKKANATSTPHQDTAEDYLFHNVENQNELVDYFKEWYQTIIRTVDKGEITDPLGDMVELVGTPQIRQVHTDQQVAIDPMPTVQLSSDRRTIKVENLNLTANQEIEMSYRIRLKTDDPGFISGHWYQANKRTILQPTPERSKDQLDFGIPSVKAETETFTILVKKTWVDKFNGTEDYFGLRAPVIDAILQKKTGSEWRDITQVQLHAENQWQATFDDIPAGSDHTYRVIEKVEGRDRVYGYGSPSYNHPTFTSKTMGSEGIQITNSLLTTDYLFTKLRGDSNTPFIGDDKPQFTVTRMENGIVAAATVKPDHKGDVYLPDLPIGSYKVEETQVPAGYQKMPDFEIIVTESSDGRSVEAAVEGITNPHIVKNQKRTLTLVVHKVDDRKQPLQGANFQLNGPDNYEKAQLDGPTFTFENLSLGTYRLTETKTPVGYIGMKDALKFELYVLDGKYYVRGLENHPSVVAYDETEENNQLAITIRNDMVKRPLPNTGGIGRKDILAKALLFLGAGSGLGFGLIVLNKRKGIR
ncbi:pilus protein [Enterococcus florum]|uniref:Pilus protein n=1 Tax=Enterococcus florum TaxID=2480627 RepID=A0A4P5P8P0_9ENTE|nr:SpaA isopeptide-forming pilin-related protein [Enterococcus florum]GCF94387.1 pilus protein [Enterococcus florum]